MQKTIQGLKPQKHEQRLLKNMGAHAVVLELLKIPYEKVSEEKTPKSEEIAHFYPIFVDFIVILFRGNCHILVA